MLPNGYVKLNNETEDARSCHRRGWIYSYQDPQDALAIRYTFPSPLHRASVSWRLQPTDDMPSFDSLYALSVSTISKFKPSQLRVPIRRAGGQSSTSPPEAQYQQEFYRCVFEATFGHVRITPEFASAKNAKVTGRIDLFIPNSKWGIEITRDGSRLNAHDARFQDNGAYGAWTKSGMMDDYIFLDFRRGVPRKPHPNIAKLFHVVFDDQYQTVKIYDKDVQELMEIKLLETHN